MITKYYDQDNSTSLVWNHRTSENMFVRKCESRGCFLLKLNVKKKHSQHLVKTGDLVTTVPYCQSEQETSLCFAETKCKL